MSIVTFTHSEKSFYEDRQRQARELLHEAQREAIAAGKVLIGTALADICESHGQEPPDDAELVKDTSGKVIGLIWGDEAAKFETGELKIDGAAPPLPKPRPAL